MLRNRTDDFMHNLNVARTLISRGVTKTQTLASALHRCEYARTRSDFVDRIRGVLQDLRVGSQDQLGVSEAGLLSVESQLMPLAKNSVKVAGILRKTF
jgi:hypothetical protein